VEGYCASNEAWRWKPQTHQIPHANSLDLLDGVVFLQCCKHHHSTLFSLGSTTGTTWYLVVMKSKTVERISCFNHSKKIYPCQSDLEEKYWSTMLIATVSIKLVFRTGGIDSEYYNTTPTGIREAIKT
jgi:hypothetical protein